MNKFISFLLIGTLFFILVSCNQPQKDIEVRNIVTVEVTRIVQVTLTPTLGQLNISKTKVANEIGTPIIADPSCYETAQSQLDLNNCANLRMTGLGIQMNTLLQLIQEKTSKEGFEQLSQFQIEWQDFSIRECKFLSGAILIESDGVYHYAGGSMAPMQLGECLVSKYEDRLRQLQIYLFEHTR